MCYKDSVVSPSYLNLLASAFYYGSCFNASLLRYTL